MSAATPVCLDQSVNVERTCMQAWLVSEQKEVDVTNLWKDDDVMVLVAARSMG